MTTVAFVDESTSGKQSPAWHLEIFEETLTLGELIRRRVFQEVAEHNARGSRLFNGLVQPEDTEATLNGYRMRADRADRVIDAQQQFDKAAEAFNRNGYVVLVDDRQVEDLDAAVAIKQGTTVTFLKLVPLVGG